MHQALLVRADKGENPTIIKNNPLRFIRSSSSSIPTQVIAEIEKVFGAPLIEAYGMTEAAHQMCSNPLPPAQRRPGSVGLAAGPEVAIMDDDGTFLGADQIGEVVIRW
jgi:acyl-CoA synthetase (AMP-forming)/AMP-acid ligase II